MKKTTLLYIIKNFFYHNLFWIIPLMCIYMLKVIAPTTWIISMLALFFFVLCDPLVNHIEKKVNSHSLAVTIFLVLFLLVILFGFGYILPGVVSQTGEFIKYFPNIQKNIMHIVADYQAKFNFVNDSFYAITRVSLNDIATKYIQQIGESTMSVLNNMIQSLSKVVTFIFHLFIGFIASMYLLYEKKSIFGAFMNYFNKKVTKKEKTFVKGAYHQLINYFSGMIFISVVKFIVFWIFFAVIKVKYALLLSLWTGILEFVPVFGPIISLVFIVIVVLLQSTTLLIPILIFFAVAQFIISNILSPQILGKTTNFSPLTIFFILLISAELAGMRGMIFGVPVVSVVMLWRNIYIKRA